MESDPCKRSPFDRKRIMEELVRGRGFTEKLGETLAGRSQNENNPPELNGGLELMKQDLLEKLLQSFKDVLSMFSPEELEEASQADTARPMKRCKMNTSDDSEGSVWSSLATPSDRRGCYKSRADGLSFRRGNRDMRTKITPTISTDNHQWRKYGQKSIKNAAHPRSYFRCTYQADKGCPATKQVQKISKDPVMFCTTYHGHHTCTDDPHLESLEIAFDSRGDVQGNRNPPFFLSFNRNHMIGNPAKNEQVHVASSSNDYPGIFSPKGDNANLYPDHRDIVCKGRHTNVMADWDDLSHFITNCRHDAE